MENGKQHRMSVIGRFKSLLFFVVFAVIEQGHCGETYKPPVLTDPYRVQKMQKVFPLIDKMLQDHAETYHIPAYAFAIVADGKIIHQKYSKGINENSVFRIASMTKSFTAMAIVKLRDEGKLKLDDSVYLYIPELKNQKLTNDSAEITIRDLLVHASGLPQDDPWGDRKLAMNAADFREFLQNGLSFSNASATQFEYSNLGYVILGQIIEKVSGVSYQDYIAQNIWLPLGMRQSAWEYSKIPAKQFVPGYKWYDVQWKPEAPLHDGVFAAMGGMLSTISDFTPYIALHSDAWPPRDDAEAGLIKRSSLREMQQAWRLFPLEKDPVTKGYGYGLFWMRDAAGKVFVGHSGGLPGYGSNWTFLPDYGIGVVLFANVTYAPANDINHQILDKLITDAQLKPRLLPPSERLLSLQQSLLKILPNWNNAEKSGIFADNFFIDQSLQDWKKESQHQFEKIGPIERVENLIPENQLRGYFNLIGKKGKLKISFTTSPEKIPKIQKMDIEQI
jgi:CubicO group peptidase (beta-lactamase class C family)